jgi:hypothetical protein
VIPPRLFPLTADDSSVLMSDSCHLLHSFEIASSGGDVEKDRVVVVVLWIMQVVVLVDMERSAR